MDTPTWTRDPLAVMSDALDRISTADLTPPTVSYTWHGASDDTIRAVIALFPDATWRAHTHDGTEWVTGELSETVHLHAFARRQDTAPPRPPESRLVALLPEQTR